MTLCEFQFVETGPLIDRDLELVEPAAQFVDEHLAACHDPLTKSLLPEHAKVQRDQLMRSVLETPRGRFSGDARMGLYPIYNFWLRVRDPFPAVSPASLRIVGCIGFRVGHGQDLEMYLGHVGYHVYPAARGRHFAERACRLLFPLARQCGIDPLWITCNPDNLASRRTLERLGGQLIDIAPIPQEHAFYARGERQKCRFRFDLSL